MYKNVVNDKYKYISGKSYKKNKFFGEVLENVLIFVILKNIKKY